MQMTIVGLLLAPFGHHWRGRSARILHFKLNLKNPFENIRATNHD